LGEWRAVSGTISAPGHLGRCRRIGGRFSRAGIWEAISLRLAAYDVFVIGGSFGGAAALLASLDPRVKKVIANCAVVDWAIVPREEKKETSNADYAGSYCFEDHDVSRLR
jgi:pimeloyl-ACP methyl ester carboxylesterase